MNGAIDAHSAPDWEALLRPRVVDHPRIALDLRDVEFLSSAGLRVLLGLLKLGQDKGAKVVLLSPRDTVREVIQIAGFDTLFSVFASEAELP